MRTRRKRSRYAGVMELSAERAGQRQRFSWTPSRSPTPSAASPSGAADEPQDECRGDDAADWSFAAWSSNPAQHQAAASTANETPAAKRSRPGPAQPHVSVFRPKHSGMAVNLALCPTVVYRVSYVNAHVRIREPACCIRLDMYRLCVRRPAIPTVWRVSLAFRCEGAYAHQSSAALD